MWVHKTERQQKTGPIVNCVNDYTTQHDGTTKIRYESLDV